VFVAGARQAIAELLAEGRSPGAIAQTLDLARNTVYYHVRRLREDADRGEEVAGAVIPPRAHSSVPTRAAVRSLLDDGLTRAEIATRLR